MFSVLSFDSIKNIPVSSYLSLKEIKHLNSLPDFKKKDYLSSRFNIKREISRYYPIDLKKIEIIKEKSGKPYFKKANISISHCDGYSLSAVSLTKAGVDIESIRHFNDNFLRSFLTEREYLAVKENPVLATLSWSIKESYLKALGLGLRRHPKSVEFIKGVLYDKGKKVKAKIEFSLFKRKYILTKVII